MKAKTNNQGEPMNNAPDIRPEQNEPRVVTPPVQYPGVRRREYYQDDSRSKSPALATLMSLVPGLGQVYVGYYQQAFINIMVVAALITLLSREIDTLAPFAGIFLVFFWLYNMVDAYRKAAFYNQALAGLGPLELPEEVQRPDRKGALYAGVLFIVAGAIALAHTRFGMPLDWLDRWWPVIFILTGAFLLYRSWADRTKA